MEEDLKDAIETIRQATGVIETIKDTIAEIESYKIKAEQDVGLAETEKDAAYDDGRRQAAEDILAIIKKSLKQ